MSYFRLVKSCRYSRKGRTGDDRRITVVDGKRGKETRDRHGSTGDREYLTYNKVRREVKQLGKRTRREGRERADSLRVTDSIGTISCWKDLTESVLP